MRRNREVQAVAIYSLEHSSIGRSTHRAGTAGAHARYITRKHAASAVLGEHMPTGASAVSTWLDQQEAADRKNARVIDKLRVCFPIELTSAQRLALVRRYLQRIGKGRLPWIAAVHDLGKDAQNPHAHLIIRDRDIETGRRVAQLSEKASTNRLRKLWEEEANHALQEAGHTVRITSRSLKAQGIDRPPERHRGPRRRPHPKSPVSFPTADLS